MIVTNTINLMLAKQTFTKARIIRDALLAFGILSVILILGGWSPSEDTKDVIVIFGIAMALIAFVELGSHTFDEFKNSRSSYQWVTLPATQFEKWSANFITSFLLVPILALVIFCFASIAASLILNLTGSISALPIFNPFSQEAWGLLKAYWVMHPILFFAAIYFKNRPIIKLAGIGALLFLSWILYMAFIGDLFFDHLPEPDFHKFENFDEHSTFTFGPFEWRGEDFHYNPNFMFTAVTNLICLSYFVYFWGLSFLRLKELEL